MSLNPDRPSPSTETVTTPVMVTAKDTRVLRAALKSAIKSCEFQANINMAMIVFSILSCITALLVGDKIDLLFMSGEEKHALARAASAKYKIMEKIASYDDRVITDMDAVYDKLSDGLGMNLPSSKVSSNTVLPSTADKAKPVPSVDPDEPPPNADYIDPKNVSLPIEKYEAMKEQTKILQTERAKLKTERDALAKLTDPILREQNDFYREKISGVEKQISDEEQKISNSEKQREVLWKAREEQNQKIGNLNEKLSTASTMSEVRSIFSTAFIRGGALFLLVWLVKIFVRKHQHAINGKEFYSSALNALRIKGIKTFAEFEIVAKGLRSEAFELRDADIELLSYRQLKRLGNLVKPLVK